MFSGDFLYISLRILAAGKELKATGCEKPIESMDTPCRDCHFCRITPLYSESIDKNIRKTNPSLHPHVPEKDILEIYGLGEA